jgi:hypothetical protein
MGYKQLSKLDGTNVLSLADAKEFLRVDHATSAEDDVITAYINAAVSYCENYCSKLFDQRAVNFYLSDFEKFIFPYSDVQVTSVNYRKGYTENYDNELTSGTKYVQYGGTPSWIKFINVDWYAEASQDDPYPLSVVANVGNFQHLDDPTGYTPPESVKQAVRMLVGHYYEQRTATVVGSIVSSVPMGVHALLNPERYIRIES